MGIHSNLVPFVSLLDGLSDMDWCDVSASCMAVINSAVYLKAEVGNSEPTRLN